MGAQYVYEWVAVGGLLLFAYTVETWHDAGYPYFWAVVSGVIAAAALLLILTAPIASWARDDGQWEASEPAIREWFQSLMQPDNPSMSCCGEADAYWADEIHVRDGKTYAVVTDDRDDTPRGRPHVDIGTEIEIPDYKLKWDRSNPTGHGVVFLSRSQYVFCYVQPGGV